MHSRIVIGIFGTYSFSLSRIAEYFIGGDEGEQRKPIFSQNLIETQRGRQLHGIVGAERVVLYQFGCQIDNSLIYTHELAAMPSLTQETRDYASIHI